MLIGALIGLFLDSLWTFWTVIELQKRVRQHNANRAKVFLYGEASFKPSWIAITASALVFISAGAIIGWLVEYFMGG